ncbi:N-acetylmuramoyl-L-alanine amidase [Patescibacteria group bacterium]|nr:N-acetylmuramoyl-L-alanine amidase [Patescibacteria group bacterium]
MKYFVFGALVIVGIGIWWLNAAGQFSFRDSHNDEMEFIDDADTTRSVITEPTDYPEASTSVTYLPPIPEPTNPDGRTRWAAYWEPMNAEEYAVYGPTTRPAGPPRVGIQAGHWQRENLPNELSGLTGSSGATAGGYTETEVNLAVAEEVVKLLTNAGIEVTLLPVTVPIDYLADAFISIHADGNTDTSISGFKIAPPRTDYSGKAQRLVDAMYPTYEQATGLKRDEAFTRRMSGYYAFNWRRYDHAVHPQTPSAIVEMGFLTNASDRTLMTTQPALIAEGIANGIINYLTAEGLLTTE